MAEESFAPLYPAYAVPLKLLLALETWVPHQSLLKQGLLVELKPGQMRPFVFVSHQWRGTRHPDLDGQQFCKLQSVLRNLAAGKCSPRASLETEALFMFQTQGAQMRKGEEMLQSWEEEMEEPLVWIDFLSVPQPTAESDPDKRRQVTSLMVKAIQSVAAYVQMATFFMVLAPPLMRTEPPIELVDYGSWQQRGWCLMERTAWHLSGQEHSEEMLLVEDDSSVVLASSGMFHATTLGTATWTDTCDQDRLEPLLYRLLEMRRRRLQKAGNWDGLRSLLQVQGHYLQQLPLSFARIQSRPSAATKSWWSSQLSVATSEAFMAEITLGSVSSGDGLGRTPLHLAAARGDLKVIQALLSCRADPKARTKDADWPLLTPAQAAPIHFAAAWCCQPREAGEQVLRTLLDASSSVHWGTAGGVTPLHLAAVWNNSTMASLLLERMAEVNKKDNMGLSPLLVACAFSASDTVKVLLKQQANLSPSSSFISLGPVHIAAGSSAPGAVIPALLEAGADPNALASAKDSLFPPWARSHHSRVGALWGLVRGTGATPLMAAAVSGSVQAARALLEGRADVELRGGEGGRSPQEVALEVDQTFGSRGQVLQQLLRGAVLPQVAMTGRCFHTEI